MCLNNSKTISDCLNSVRLQTYRNIEHIIIDGGSTDGTLKIVERFLSDRVKVVSEPDFGVYDAMNKGLLLATGDIVCFLNSDDRYIDENVIDEVVSHFSSAGPDIVLADVNFFDPRRPQRIIRKYPAFRFNPSSLKFGWMPPHPGFFCRRKIYDKFGSFDVSYKIAGDFDFIARVFSSDRISYSYLNKVAVSMATGGISTSGLKSKITLNREVMRACKQNRIRTNWLFLMMKYPLKMWDMIFVKPL
ncbi:glycosyltransferase [Rhodobacterales bacterium HKCCA1288]|nr:glycosyltransferase [Rhodobacterales bacterium HKCCA1288]